MDLDIHTLNLESLVDGDEECILSWCLKNWTASQVGKNSVGKFAENKWEWSADLWMNLFGT